MHVRTRLGEFMNSEMRNTSINCAAFVSAMNMQIGVKNTMAQFRVDTGINYTPAQNPIDAAIDKVTGRDKDFIKSFAEWFAKSYWGIDDAPDLDLIFDFESGA